MLKTPDAKVLEALANLEANGNFRVIVDWLVKSKDETIVTMSASSGDTLYRAQGAYGVLSGMHNHAVSARAALAKLSTRSP